ncbi:hypothetical protein EMCRGX_G010708 [Ephydatia muelleri]
MELALKEVRDGRMSRNAASKAFGVPRSTLCDKLDGKTPEDRRMGPPSVLTKAEEAMLANFCTKYLKCGFPINREDLFDIVQRIIQVDGRQTPFTDGRPGYYWFQGFMRRNPALTERSAEILTGGRAAVTEAAIRKWFNDIKTYVVDEEHAGDVFQDPLRIFNFDESNFLLARKKGKVLGPVNYKSFLQSSQENDKEGLTVLMGYSASGKIAPPMIVYSYKQHIPRDVIEAVESADPTWAAGRSDTGWMTSVTFYDYISQVFEPWLTANHVPRPVLVYADGHKSHLSLEIAEFCREKRILLVALYPNSTHLLQPLDVSVFKSLKNLWTTAKNLWKASNPLANISKKVFPNVFKKAVDQKVDYSKCVKDQQVREIEDAEELTIDDCGLLHLRTGRRFLEERIGHDKLQIFKMILDLLSMICQVKIFKKQATLQDASHPSDALQDASHPSDALQDASHPSDALQDASHPSDALQEASHPSDTIPTEDLAAELLHSNDSCSPSISNNMAENIESSYETSAAIDPPCDSSNVTLTSFVPDVSEPPITSGLSNSNNHSCLLQSHQF